MREGSVIGKNLFKFIFVMVLVVGGLSVVDGQLVGTAKYDLVWELSVTDAEEVYFASVTNSLGQNVIEDIPGIGKTFTQKQLGIDDIEYRPTIMDAGEFDDRLEFYCHKFCN